jgi:hypothetical protein
MKNISFENIKYFIFLFFRGIEGFFSQKSWEFLKKNGP